MQKSNGLKKVVRRLNGLNENERPMKEKEIKMRRMNSLNGLYDIKLLIFTQIAKNVNNFFSFFIFLIFFNFFNQTKEMNLAKFNSSIMLVDLIEKL